MRSGSRTAAAAGDGTLDTALGRARFTAPPAEGRLEVTFLRFGSWWVWPVSGEYEVVALDPDYRWSLVGHPSRDYAWILAREPALDDAVLLDLRDRLGHCRLRSVPTDPDRGRRPPSRQEPVRTAISLGGQQWTGW